MIERPLTVETDQENGKVIITIESEVLKILKPYQIEKSLDDIKKEVLKALKHMEIRAKLYR